ncbi:MAG TPA: DNA primase, partial [Edaphobacter sp.]
SDPARQLAATRLAEHPEFYDGLPSAGVIDVLANAAAPENPLDAAPDHATRVMLARALEHAHDPEGASVASLADQVEDALHTLERRGMERRQRELRAQIAEAERRGDVEMVARLTQELIQLNRRLREH